MKAAPFDYISAGALEEAVQQLSEAGDDGLIIAGGQTLMPMMAMRLARPSVVIDINKVAALSGIDQTAAGLQINTCTRQNFALNAALLGEHVPLLAKALPFVGHHQTRNRGTIGGSLAHGDPASEIPLVAVTLDAKISLHSSRQTRQVVATEFYDGPMMTVRAADECLTDVVFPAWSDGATIGCGFQEVSQRHGDFAIVSAAAQISLDGAGICQRAAIAIGGVSGVPVRLVAAEAVLTGQILSSEIINDALHDMASALDPADDQQASAAYRRRVARVMVERVITEAIGDAEGKR